MNEMPEAVTDADEQLDTRRKKLRFRSWHRGMREMDFILGRFADAEIGGLTDDELDQYERLLDFPDDRFFLLITGDMPVPAHLECPLLHRILAFGRTFRI